MDSKNSTRAIERYEMRVFGQTLAAIIRHEKTHEVRVAYPPLEKIRVGDILSFADDVERTVISITRFKNIELCIEALGVNAILPGYTPDQVVGVWSTREDVQKNVDALDLLAFELE